MTTLAEIQAGRPNLDFTITIGGINLVLTTGDATAAVTAYAGTDFASATGVPNLMIVGDVEQRLEPWKGTPDVSRLTFAVMPTADTAAGDVFGRLVFGQANGVETYLSTALDCDDTTVAVLSTSSFAASGTIHIGTEAITYSGKTGTTFTGCTRGKYAPARESGAGIGQAHRIPTIADGVTMSPKVTSLPREWIGRWVTVRAHQVTAGVLDTVANAQTIWAGRITNLRDEANGLTYIDCDDVRGKLRDTVLMRDQWTARVAEGIYLREGWYFRARDQKAGTGLDANDLVVVSSGAAGANEINAGQYTMGELTSAINDWLAAEKVAARLNFNWTFGINGEPRTFVRFTVGSATETNLAWFFAPGVVNEFLGFGDDDSLAVQATFPSIAFSWDGAVAGETTSPEEPYRILVYSQQGPSGSVYIEDERGTWFANESKFPAGLESVSTTNLGVVQVNGGPAAVFRRVSSSQLTGAAHDEDMIQAITGTPWDISGHGWLRRVRYSSTGALNLRQIAVIYSTVEDALLQTIVSTGTANHNHNPADVLPAQLGAAIPFEYLGTDFETTIAAISESSAPILLVIEKPKKWTDVFGADLVARQLHLVWKSGTLVMKTWGTPTAAHAEHALTDVMKQAPVNTNDPHRTVANQTDEWLANTIKLAYNFVLSGGEPSTITLSAPSSQSIHGERPVTIDLRNTFAGIHSTSAAVVELADNLAQSLSVFTHPLHILRRTIPITLFESIAPGDFVTVTDAFARSPTDGSRGLSSKPGLVVRTRIDWGGYEIDTGQVRPPSGEVDVLIMPLSTISIYSPSARLSSYDAGTKVITCAAHAFSESSEAADATHFAIGDKVYIVEYDPSDPASFLSWSDTVAGQSGNTITLTTGLGGFDAARFYRVVSDSYTTAVTSQRSDVYQADDADGFILDTVGAYTYGNDPGQATEWTIDQGSGSDFPALYANTNYGDGRPLSTALEFDAARLINAMVNYRCNSLMNTLQRGTAKTYTGAGRKIVEVQPVHLGPGELMLGEKYLRVNLLARSTDGTSTTVTISLCRGRPTGSSWTSTDLTAMDYQLTGPYETQTSAAITSTTYAEIGPFDFSIRSIDPLTGIGYLVVEIAAKAETYGIAQAHPLPYDEAA